MQAKCIPVLFWGFFSFFLQEVREMINLPETNADMLPGDFEGIAEALKGTDIKHSHVSVGGV